MVPIPFVRSEVTPTRPQHCVRDGPLRTQGTHQCLAGWMLEFVREEVHDIVTHGADTLREVGSDAHAPTTLRSGRPRGRLEGPSPRDVRKFIGAFENEAADGEGFSLDAEGHCEAHGGPPTARARVLIASPPRARDRRRRPASIHSIQHRSRSRRID